MQNYRLSALRLILLTLLFPAGFLAASAQDAVVYMPNIKSPQLYMAGNQLGYPILKLNSADQLELHFDDLDADVKNYSYTIQLCNEDWSQANVSTFDYIRGFQQVRITNYQFSSIALTHYTHYQAACPDANLVPIHSGNYLLKVFLDGDTTKLAFTHRFLVVEGKVNINHQVLQPLDFALAHTYQRIRFKVNTSAVNPMNPLEQIKVDVLQNYRWESAVREVKPTFYVNNTLDYNDDNAFVFAAGSEYRWADLRSFRFQSDRVGTVNYGKTATDIFLKPDGDRSNQPYLSYRDLNGFYTIETTESYNPYYQIDYATVKFTFVPPGKTPFTGRDVYISGQFTGGGLNDSTKMVFNADKGVYERSFFLKQGYYSYLYVTTDQQDADKKPSFDQTEGNHLETENQYIILVYYRAPGARADELVGLSTFNSVNLQ